MAKHTSGMSLIIVTILALAIGWFGHQYFGTAVSHVVEQVLTAHSEPNQESEQTNTNPPSDHICAEVITPARDPKSGDIKEFPTPCAVPEGWEVIQNDIPGL